MASEALDEADTSSASPAPSDKAAAAAALPVSDNGANDHQQSHVSEARADANEQQQSNGSDHDGSGRAASQEPSVQKANVILCGVCGSNPGKYKCSRCRLPYCSVPCSKAHQQNHPPDAPKEEPKPTTQSSSEPAAASVNVPPQAAIDPTNPFGVLATSDKLQLLFKKYPNLPNQLLEIHAATQPPSDGPDAAARAIPASLREGFPVNTGRNAWNHDIGIKNGKAALRRARKADGEDGEAIREYTELIVHIMNETEDKNSTAAYVQRQVAEQDTALIERLLAEERRRE
ncbi:hypothetical protein CCMA1212_008949 [Trichoderma ghanense]|uniref:HIT-type domain-containing protein n=1 Tax=Trichoderma ghanense TaxID=65468 RepID=A0ABY2GUG1_9HYPO